MALTKKEIAEENQRLKADNEALQEQLYSLQKAMAEPEPPLSDVEVIAPAEKTQLEVEQEVAGLKEPDSSRVHRGAKQLFEKADTYTEPLQQPIIKGIAWYKKLPGRIGIGAAAFVVVTLLVWFGIKTWQNRKEEKAVVVNLQEYNRLIEKNVLLEQDTATYGRRFRESEAKAASILQRYQDSIRVHYANAYARLSTFTNQKNKINANKTIPVNATVEQYLNTLDLFLADED